MVAGARACLYRAAVNVSPRPNVPKGPAWLRVVYACLATLFASGVVIQVFLAGLGVLVSPSYFAWHASFAHLLEPLLFLLVLFAALARAGWRAVGIAVLLLILFGAQYAFLYGLQGAGRALHLVNALAMFWLATRLGGAAWARVFGAEPAALRLALPGDGAAVEAGPAAAPTDATSGPSAQTRRRLARWVPVAALVLTSAVGVTLVAARTANAGSAATTPPSTNVTTDGSETTTGEATSAPAGAGAALFDANCAACHGRDGRGGVGPSLADERALGDADFVIDRILNGEGIMPAWRSSLTDEQIAQVASYIRGAWGNDYGAVSPAQVAAQR